MSYMDVPIPITFFERNQLDERSKGAHEQVREHVKLTHYHKRLILVIFSNLQILCQRCCTLKSPCWIPHKLSECAKCQRSRWKCCFDASNFLECCFVVNVKSVNFIYDYATLPKLMGKKGYAMPLSQVK